MDMRKSLILLAMFVSSCGLVDENSACYAPMIGARSLYGREDGKESDMYNVVTFSWLRDGYTQYMSFDETPTGCEVDDWRDYE